MFFDKIIKLSIIYVFIKILITKREEEEEKKRLKQVFILLVLLCINLPFLLHKHFVKPVIEVFLYNKIVSFIQI